MFRNIPILDNVDSTNPLFLQMFCEFLPQSTHTQPNINPGQPHHSG